MKMISTQAFIGMSILVWMGGIVSGVFGQNNDADFNFMHGAGSAEDDEFCKEIGHWNWKEQCEREKYQGLPPGTSQEKQKCVARCALGIFNQCCNGGTYVCDDCQIDALSKFCYQLRKQIIKDGVIPEYCNNYERPGVCGKSPTNDKDLCDNTSHLKSKHGKNQTSLLKSSFLLMIATITITIYFTLPMFC